MPGTPRALRNPWLAAGALCAFAGIVLSAKLKSGQPSTSVGAETDAIASAVLGGTSMYGGTGRTFCWPMCPPDKTEIVYDEIYRYALQHYNKLYGRE